MQRWNILSNDSDEDLLDESSNDVAETSGEETKTRQECAFCASCTEEYPLSDTIRTECAHNYCRECILRLFENSLTHEALFPPRCCRLPIRVSTAVEDMLGIEMIKRYQERKVEVNDLRRTYCSNPTCSHYIPPQNIRHGVGICGVCTVRTCTDCKKQAHRGGDCSKHRHAFDEKINDNLLEELAKKKKWKRCSKCSRIIELIDGCFSIQ
ncbi:unnamed protein product [Penicillium nalgiovense]|uniref:RBR-type E3 ubiquitin transferase n=1 Tax=Penicillium nalgiovense TaxID=60175 RepID=A0A9W4HQF9_PENNA|nr:unnamed protein product [Penicillium nalgiovense]CAG7994139.1 unnamed protein product [Penicillium nalgiovense]CAG8007648.1 unnamed protein product [Penicillium nalgiovense]CAG8053950.1 unnamed protein product [Penicillium nalgiovense]CAG8054458.1 unnamed protein product [Penicillium nalgiovense]